MTTPLSLAQALQSPQSQIIFKCASLFVGQVRDLHWLQRCVDNDGGSQAGAQAEKKHASAFVNAQCLHRRIIQNLDGSSESFLEVESYPSSSEVVRLTQGVPVNHRSRIADRDGRIIPTCCHFSDLLYHLAGGHFRPRNNIDGLLLPGGQHFYVCPAHINHQYFFRVFVHFHPRKSSRFQN